jgi:hypothetical protein
MISLSTSPIHVTTLRKANVWYSIADGNWNNPATWLSNGRKRNNSPQAGDTVYIYHTVTANINATVKNVYVKGILKLSNVTLTITGDLQATGTIDQSATPSFIKLSGVNNFIDNFLPGASTIEYARFGDQDIMYLPYYNLTISGGGNKYIYADLTVTGTTTLNGGNSGGNPTLYKLTQAGKITFIGLLMSINISSPAIFNNTINADIEFNTGILVDYRGVIFNLGTGNIYLNGPNIQLTFNGGGGTSGYENYNNILIMGNSIVTVTSNTPFVVNGSINGETSNSTLRISGIFHQGTTTEPMSTGNFIPNYGGMSTIGYTYNGDYTLPYTAYSSLVIKGSGTKKLSGDTTLTTLTTAGGTLELSSYNFIVTGAFNQTAIGGGIIKNHSNGETIFTGKYLALGSNFIFQFNYPCLIEFRNGIDIDIRGFLNFVIASGSTLKFSTNNQSIKNGGGSLMLAADILISGAITVTLISSNNYGTTGILNGDNSMSKFSVQPGGLNSSFTYKNTQSPMQIGALDCNASPNTFLYALEGPQDIAPNTYRNLTLTGSGSKKLLGNVSVSNSYVLNGTSTLNTNGYTLTNP